MDRQKRNASRMKTESRKSKEEIQAMMRNFTSNTKVK